MSTLYHVFVSKKPSPTTVELSIQVVHPDAMHIYDTPGFALMLLQECSKENNLLAEEVDFDTVMDAAWLKKYAQGFIQKVELLEVENPLPKAARDDYEHPYWEDPENWLSGTLRIVLTHEAWAQHANEGLDWESASFDPNDRYDTCAPILPSPNEAVVSAGEEDHTGFLAIPNYFFEATLPLQTPVWIPIYGEKAYVMGEQVKGKDITEEVRDSFLGKPAFFKGSWSEDLGVLCSHEMAFTIGSGSYGQVGVEGSNLKWIAPAQFNKGKKRLNAGLSYQKILGWVDPFVAASEVEGNTVTFKVYAFSGDRRLEFADAGEALSMLGRTVSDQMGDITDEESKLGGFLEKEKEERDIYFTSELFTKIGGGMVLEYQVKQVKKASHPDLDSLEIAVLVEELKKEPWATWEIKIKVSDPAWLEHLADRGPFHYNFSQMNPVESWEGDPILWKED